MSLFAPDVEPRPFILDKATHPSPLLVEIPHAGLLVDTRSATFMTTQVRCLAWDADLFVDALFEGASADILRMRMSRHVVDANAPPDADLHAGTHEPEHRVVYRHIPGIADPIVERPIPRAERLRRWKTYYVPYQEEIARNLESKRAAFGHAVLLSAHSWDDRKERHPVDIVIGTRHRAAASNAIIQSVEVIASKNELTHRRDDPFPGGYITEHHGAPSRDVHAIQIELARRLYVDPKTLELDLNGFERLRAFLRDLVIFLRCSLQSINV